MQADGLGLIFDMDGVLIDSTATHTEAWQLYLAQHGIVIPEIESRMLGKRNDAIVRDFFQDISLSDDEVLEHGARKEQLYRQIIQPHLARHMVPGVISFLERHKELPIGLATNGEPANVDLVLRGTMIQKYFQVAVSGHEVRLPKPHPDIYLKVAEKLNVPPQNCVVFEDSLTGIEAARGAGMRVVGLTTTITRLPDVDLAIPDFLDARLEPWLQSIAASVTV
jgi:beta-phosphoglucomutase